MSSPSSSPPSSSTTSHLPLEPLHLSRKLLSTSNSSINAISSIQPSPSIETKYQSFLPKQMVMGSPFYHSFENSFKNSSNSNANLHSSSNLNNELTIHQEEVEDDKDDKDDKDDEEKHQQHQDQDQHKQGADNEEIYDKFPRSIKIENLPITVQLSDILSIISFGPIESCYYDLNTSNSTNNRSIIITFIDHLITNQCFEYLNSHLLHLNKLFKCKEDKNLKFSKLKSLKILNFLNFQINNNGASRVLCLSNLPINITDSIIINELKKFGSISSIQLNLEKNSTFVYFTSILNSIKCFNQLPLSNSILSNCNIFYSNDGDSLNKIHISYTSPSNNNNNKDNDDDANNNNSNTNTNTNTITNPNTNIINNTNVKPIPRIDQLPSSSHFDTFNLLPNNLNNRTISLKNLTPKTSIEDICNVIRGGNLENIKLFPDRRIAYLTFINHLDAANIIASLSREKIFINQRFIKIGWGKNNGDLDPIIKLEILKNNATRNLYIGINENTENNDYHLDEQTGEKIFSKIPNEEILRRDFSIFGEIEQINYFKNGACAFINFTNIKSCIQAVNDFNNENTDILMNLHSNFNNKYKDLIISYGKDRCGNPPKKKKNKKKNKNRMNNKNLINFRNYSTNDSDLYSDNESQFSYMLNNENQSIDTEIALKFDSAFENIGISSPSTKKKIIKSNSNNTDSINTTFNKKNNNNNDDDGIDGGDAGNDNDNKNDDNDDDDDKDKDNDNDDDDDDDDEDDEVDIITDTLSTSAVSSTSDLSKLNKKIVNQNSNSFYNKNHRFNNKFYNSRNSSNTSFHQYNNNTNHSNDQYNDMQPTYILAPQPYYFTPQTPKNSKFLNLNQSKSSSSSSNIINDLTPFPIQMQMQPNYYSPSTYYQTPTQLQYPMHHYQSYLPPHPHPNSYPHPNLYPHPYSLSSLPQYQPNYKPRYSNNNKRKNYNNNQKNYYVDPASPTPDK